MKKIIFAVTTAVIFSCAIGAASAYEYNKTAKKSAKTETCTCSDCGCPHCGCSASGCAHGSCDAGCTK